MRFLLSSSLIILFIGLSFLEGGLTSCTKDKTIYDTVTVVERDTVTIKDTLIIRDNSVTAAILTSHAWRVEEVRGVYDADDIYYKLGGSTNNVNYDAEYIVFNANKTGIYVNGNGIQSNITWEFADGGNIKMVWTIYNTPSTFPITWDNLRYRNDSLFYDEYHTDGNTGINSHSQQVRIAK